MLMCQVYTNNAYAIDGCATFFKRTKFSLVKKYEVRCWCLGLARTAQIATDKQNVRQLIGLFVGRTPR